MKIAIAALITASVALAAPALSQPADHAGHHDMTAKPAAGAAPSCFMTRDIRGRAIADPQTLYLRVGLKDVYRVEMSNRCLSGAFPGDPLVTEQPPGSARVCRPVDMDLALSRSGFKTPCIVKSITPLTPAEADALPKKLRP